MHNFTVVVLNLPVHVTLSPEDATGGSPQQRLSCLYMTGRPFQVDYQPCLIIIN